MGLGLLLDRRDSPHILDVKGSNDQRAQRAQKGRHGDIQEEPPGEVRSTLLLLEGVVDVYVDGRPELADVDRVVEVQ